jgi:hypothetical protein
VDISVRYASIRSPLICFPRFILIQLETDNVRGWIKRSDKIKKFRRRNLAQGYLLVQSSQPSEQETPLS